MDIYLRSGERLTAHLNSYELEASLAAQSISGVDVSITCEDQDGGYRTIKVSEIQLTRTLLALKQKDRLPIEEDSPPLVL